MTTTKSDLVGGWGGNEFADFVIPANAEITAIVLRAGIYLDALQFEYKLPDGSIENSPYWGGLGGFEHRIQLSSGEYLTGISGKCNRYIDSIHFHTNFRTTELYGGSDGQPFTLASPDASRIIGVYGRSDWFIDAIGIISQPLPEASAALVPKSDDLEKLEGIGPKIASLLQSAGITTFAQLAKTPVAQLQAILAAAGSRYRIHSPETWPEQAALAAAGDWVNLNALTDALKGGRRPS